MIICTDKGTQAGVSFSKESPRSVATDENGLQSYTDSI